jgi:hypothetical protein
MLSTNLTSSEVRDAAGAEVEYLRVLQQDRRIVFAKSGELPYLQDRLSISHTETGVGVKLRRRSAVRFDLMSISGVDSSTIITTSGYTVLDTLIGLSATDAQMKAVLARLGSFLHSAGSTLLLDGTGTGSAVIMSPGF